MSQLKIMLLRVYHELISNLRKLNFIESITLIGKPLDKRNLEKIIDIDTVIIAVSPMTEKMFNVIDHIFSQICKKYTTQNVDVLYAIADGPMKPKSFKKQEIFLHCILHTKESYNKMPLQLCKNSWQQFKPIKGKPLKKYQTFKGVTKDMLLNSALGINHLIKLVSDDSSGYIGWKKDKNHIMKWQLFPLKFKHNDEKTDLYIYSVLRAASNALRFITGNNTIGIDDRMTKLFKKKLSRLESNSLPLTFLMKKKLLRNKKSLKNLSLLKEQTLDFLKELKIYIEHYSKKA